MLSAVIFLNNGSKESKGGMTPFKSTIGFDEDVFCVDLLLNSLVVFVVYLLISIIVLCYNINKLTYLLTYSGKQVHSRKNIAFDKKCGNSKAWKALTS